jgi:two-component system, LytTR family, response regulator
VLPLTSILYIESINGYSYFHFQKTPQLEKVVISSYTLAHYEDTLPLDIFYRVHKTFMVNTQKIKQIKKVQNPELILSNDKIIPIGRRRLQEFLTYMKMRL